MVLTDTSVWVDHLRGQCPDLSEWLSRRQVVIHPYVVGELALGHFRHDDQVLETLLDQPQARVALPDEVLTCIRERKLRGSGIGYVDAHLLASVLLDPGTRLWTLDQRLHAIAQRHGVAFAP